MFVYFVVGDSAAFPLKMSSASSEKPEKQKTKRSHFASIVAVKRKKKKPTVVGATAAGKDETSSLGSEGIDFASEIHIQRQQTMASETRITEILQQLEAEKLKGAELEKRLEESESEVNKWQEKVAEFEKIGNELDDDSFAAAQEFQLKKQVEYFKAELEKHADIAEELERTQEELQEVRSQYEELEFQRKRSTTRTTIKGISEDKSAREEVARLQKELRQMDLTFQKQTSQLEAQAKVSEDSLRRAQEKALVIQRRLDDVDNEKLQLKIENKRLQRKLEKQGTYTERKRLETEKETHELELQNLRRQKAKLERRLSTSMQSLDLLGSLPVSPESSRPSSRISDQDSFPEEMSLSEMRIRKLEMELNKLEANTFTLNKDNENLKEELASTKQSEERLTLEVEKLRKSLADERAEFALLEAEVEKLRGRASAGSAEAYIDQLQVKYEKLEKVLQDKEVEFRVKEKSMRATNEELKRQMEELEIAKLRAELGEPEEGEEEEDLTDVEDNEETSDLRQRLNSLQLELDSVKINNVSLQDEMEKKKKEADELLKTIEDELDQVETLEVSRDDKLGQRNEELKAKLQEQSQKYEEALHEVMSLRETVSHQVCTSW